LIDITDVALDEYDKWLKDCWEPMKECGDFNGDGITDSNDILEKWITNCIFLMFIPSAYKNAFI